MTWGNYSDAQKRVSAWIHADMMRGATLGAYEAGDGVFHVIPLPRRNVLAVAIRELYGGTRWTPLLWPPLAPPGKTPLPVVRVAFRGPFTLRTSDPDHRFMWPGAL